MNRPRARIAVLIGLVVLAAGLVLAIRSRQPVPIAVRPTPEPSSIPTRPRPGYTPVPAGAVSPVVVYRSPERGEELSPNGVVELVFDRAMNRASVEAALSISPAVAGSIEWPDARTVRFIPTQSLQRAALYDLVLGQQARAEDGAPLNSAYQFRFATAGYLEVAQVIPANGTQEVTIDSTITVIFNRPVVPLTVVEQQDSLPQPLSFEPAIEGQGEWLNTSIYIFRPSQPLAGGTTYTARVSAELRDLDDNPLPNEFTWSFTTVRPKVVFAWPEDGAQLIPVDPAIRLTFNQPVDPAGAQAAFNLRAPDGSSVPGTLQVIDETLIFTPAARLGFDQIYSIDLAAGLVSRSGGKGMSSAFHSTFRTVPLPRILRTEPADGAQDVSPYTDFTIVFNTPIDPDSVMANIQMTPPLSPTQVYTHFNTYNNSFHIAFGAQPSTEYAVHIGPNIVDPYGNTTGQILDVRFSTSPLPPSAELIVPGLIGTYSAQNPARIAIRSVNQDEAALALYRLQPDDLKKQYWSGEVPGGAELLRRWRAPLDAPLNKAAITRVALLEDGGRLDPGIYLLHLDQPYGVQPHLLVVSDLNLTIKAGERDVLIWANDLQSGQPVEHLRLKLFDDQGAALGTATTGADGVARVRLDRTESRSVLAIAEQPFAAVGSWWDTGSISPWAFGLQGMWELPEFAGHIYTDRPIYRPGQTVTFKGVLRAEDDVRFSLPANMTAARVIIRSAAGEQIYEEILPLSANGTFEGRLELPQGAVLGAYSIETTIRRHSFYASFQVAAYRPPEFQVTVTPQSSEIIRGTKTTALVDVSYFFGGPVANIPVQWNVLAESYTFSPDWGGRYRFSDSADPWLCWDCWWIPAPPPRPILSGSGTTDAQGRLLIELPAQLMDADGKPITDSVRLTIEASASGRDHQVIAGREDMIVHGGEIYLGLAPQTYVGRAGDEQKLDLVVADIQGQRQAGRTVDVEVFRYTWKNRFVRNETGGGRWEWQEQRALVAQQTLTTDATGAAIIAFTPAEGGSYRVVATARDSGGREVRSSLFLWVAGDEYVSWRRDNNNRITLISDRTSYKPGETAEILIPSPFQAPHWALISVERGGILSYEVRRMEGNSAIYSLPLTAEHAPNIYVSVVLFSPPDSTAPGGPLPADYKMGILPLAVEPEPQLLRITITPSAEQAEPGSEVSYEIQVSDSDGRPVAAELSLDLVDKAVLSLLPRTPNAIREAFYGKRPLGIITALDLTISGDRLQQQIEQDLARRQDDKEQGAPGGGHAGPSNALPPALEAPTAGEMPESADRAAGYQAQAPAPTIREEFADTAYWNPNVVTDSSGRATIRVRLPDNLTTWVMRGVGLTRDTRVGEGLVEVVASKPLLIRPVTPRFFVVGDRVELAANISNNTDQSLQVQVGLAARGLISGSPLTQTVQVPARGEAQVTWQVTAEDVEYADVLFTAISDSYSDVSRPRLATGPNGTLPVYRYSVPEVVGTGGQLETAGSRTEAIGLPPNIDPRNGELTVRLDPSLAAGMRDGLEYLEHYPYEGTEHTVSRFLPNLLTLRALRDLGISNPELEARLLTLVEQGLNRLYTQQHGDGGWGWWIDAESSPYVSAYVVFAFARAQEAGYMVREGVLARGLDYLNGTLVAAKDLNTVRSANRQAWVLYAMAEAGRPDSARLVELYENRHKLGIFARAFLAMALHKADAAEHSGRIKTLLADLNSAAILSTTGAHWEEQQHDWWSMNTDTRTTAIVLSALVRLDPQNQLNPNVVRWLMVARKDGIWETTQETAWSLMALTDWMLHTRELHADYDYAIWLNDLEQAGGHIGQADLDQPVVLRIAVADLLRDEGNRLTIGRGDGEGRLYYTAHLRAFLPVEEIKALDRGISVRRRYTLASCEDGSKCPEVNQVKPGDIIRVELSIVAPNDLYYVVVEDPLPAGAEHIDTSLATTSVLERDGELQRRWNDPVLLEGEIDTRTVVEWHWPWWNWYSRSELRDEKLALFADYLPKGSYVYSYTIRATLPGEFHVIPTVASESYFPEVHGRSDGQILRIVR